MPQKVELASDSDDNTDDSDYDPDYGSDNNNDSIPDSGKSDPDVDVIVEGVPDDKDNNIAPPLMCRGYIH